MKYFYIKAKAGVRRATKTNLGVRKPPLSAFASRYHLLVDVAAGAVLRVAAVGTGGRRAWPTHNGKAKRHCLRRATTWRQNGFSVCVELTLLVAHGHVGVEQRREGALLGQLGFGGQGVVPQSLDEHGGQVERLQRHHSLRRARAQCDGGYSAA